MKSPLDVYFHWLYQYNYDHKPTIYIANRDRCAQDFDFPCVSPYCPRHANRWSYRHLRRMFSFDHTSRFYRLILPYGDIVPPSIKSKVFDSFMRSLKNKYGQFRYYGFLEMATDLHWHMLIKLDEELDFDFVRHTWKKFLRKYNPSHYTDLSPRSICIDEITSEEDFQRVCDYNAKLKRDGFMHRPFKGMYKRLVCSSMRQD